MTLWRRASWISRYNSNFDLTRSNKLAVNADLELMIQRHLNKTGDNFPFFMGEYSTDAATGYYVSCFYNYTLRTVFLDISSLNQTGDIFSFQTDEAIILGDPQIRFCFRPHRLLRRK